MARGLSEVTSQTEAEFGLAAWAYTPSLPLSLALPQRLVGQLVPGCTEAWRGGPRVSLWSSGQPRPSSGLSPQVRAICSKPQTKIGSC